jgi:ribosome-associated protein
VAGDVLRVTRTCAIPISELEWRFTPSGGPGGQHANTSNTKVEVVFDIANSNALGPRQRARLLERVGTVVRATASEQRSQAQNRDVAVDRLRSKLADALKVRPSRVPTSPTPSSNERRLKDKQHRAKIKQLRRTRDDPTED